MMNIEAAKSAIGTKHFSCIASFDNMIAAYNLSTSDRLRLKNELIENNQLSLRANAIQSAPHGVSVRALQLLKQAGLHESQQYTVAEVNQALSRVNMPADHRMEVKAYLDSRGCLTDGSRAQKHAAEDKRGDLAVLKEMVEKFSVPEDNVMDQLKSVNAQLSYLLAAKGRAIQSSAEPPRYTRCETRVICS